MDKKNYNLEIFFESQKKSFVILSKNKISFDEVKQKTMKEFNISKEFEKDMKFTITSKNNRQITISKDYQILSNFDEMSKNNFYLKILFNLNNNNYVYQSSRVPLNKANLKIRMNTVNQFSIISNNKSNNVNNANVNDSANENKYKDEIQKLKKEIEKLNNEKYIKGDIDIRKFDEKYRDLCKKNNELEQKIKDLENENKTLQEGSNKNKNNDNIFDNNYEGDSLITEIEILFTKLIGGHEDNIMKEINGLKNTMNIMQKEQSKIYKKLNTIDNNEDNDDNFEILKDDNSININNKKDKKNNENKNNKIVLINNNINNSDESDFKNSERNNINNMNNIDDDNFDDLDNLADIIMDDKEDSKKINKIPESNDKNKDISKELNSNKAKNIKRNINFFDEEDEKNSISQNNSKYKSKKKPVKNLIKEIQNSFLENDNNNYNNKLMKKISNDCLRKNDNDYLKHTAPPKKKDVEKMKIQNQKQNHNYSNINKNGWEEELINYDSSSEINRDTKKLNKLMINASNSLKEFYIKIEDKKNSGINNNNKYVFNDKSMTPTGAYVSEKEKQDKYKISSKKNEHNVTPGNLNKVNTVKENIENCFINIYQNIFFYGNNGYMNLLKISDKLLKQLRDGVGKYRMNIGEVKDYTIKYITYSILPIVNDKNTKEYQRNIIKNKITTILECVRLDKNYFQKDYKEFKEDNNNNDDDRILNGVNITHAKINEFRRFYQLKEKDYPDEIIMKALIRYRGNRDMAFQFLFY